MANEAVIIELNNPLPIRFTSDIAGTITKGTICKLANPRTASASSGVSDVVAGIAAAAEVSGATSVTCYVPGQGNIFDLRTDDATIAIGQLVATSGANLIAAAAATDMENGKVLGKALESAAAATDETIAVLV